jgi:hypothetical protein
LGGREDGEDDDRPEQEQGPEGGDGEEQEDDEEEEDEDVGMEQAAVDAEENGEGDQDDEEEGEEIPRANGRSKKAAGKARQVNGTGGQNKRGADGKVIKKKTRISQIGGGEFSFLRVTL